MKTGKVLYWGLKRDRRNLAPYYHHTYERRPNLQCRQRPKQRVWIKHNLTSSCLYKYAPEPQYIHLNVTAQHQVFKFSNETQGFDIFNLGPLSIIRFHPHHKCQQAKLNNGPVWLSSTRPELKLSSLFAESSSCQGQFGFEVSLLRNLTQCARALAHASVLARACVWFVCMCGCDIQRAQAL